MARAATRCGLSWSGRTAPEFVREVTTVLADLQVNIEDFVSSTEHGAWSGEPLFRAAARLALPAGLGLDELRAALEALSGDIMVDFSFARVS